MNLSLPITSPIAADRVSLVASYHCLKKVKGAIGKVIPASNPARAASIMSNHCFISPRESPPLLLISTALRQLSAVASNHRFHNSRGLPAPCLLCSIARVTPCSHVRYKLNGLGEEDLPALPFVEFDQPFEAASYHCSQTSIGSPGFWRFVSFDMSAIPFI